MNPSAAVKPVTARIAEELAITETQVRAAVGLLDEGSTVPFIARYRKEVTGSLDDGQLRDLEERLRYLRDLDGCDTDDLYNIALRELEIPLFAEVLKHCDGNQSRAATMLGIHRATLRKKLKDYGLAS